MPYLVCSAMTCVYNNGQYCSKGDIMVGGQEAQNARETCCVSFKARTEMGGMNSMGTPSQTIDVGCKACHCQFNENSKCAAGQIGISGASACSRQQTECATFQMKQPER